MLSHLCFSHNWLDIPALVGKNLLGLSLKAAGEQRQTTMGTFGQGKGDMIRDPLYVYVEGGILGGLHEA